MCNIILRSPSLRSLIYYRIQKLSVTWLQKKSIGGKLGDLGINISRHFLTISRQDNHILSPRKFYYKTVIQPKAFSWKKKRFLYIDHLFFEFTNEQIPKS